jgi:hypothetical protein
VRGRCGTTRRVLLDITSSFLPKEVASEWTTPCGRGSASSGTISSFLAALLSSPRALRVLIRRSTYRRYLARERRAERLPCPPFRTAHRDQRGQPGEAGLPVVSASSLVVKCHGVWLTSTCITPGPSKLDHRTPRDDALRGFGYRHETSGAARAARWHSSMAERAFWHSTGVHNAKTVERAKAGMRGPLRRGNSHFKGNSGGRVTFGWNCARQGIISLASHASALRLISSGT